jgi:hypothetical protein
MKTKETSDSICLKEAKNFLKKYYTLVTEEDDIIYLGCSFCEVDCSLAIRERACAYIVAEQNIYPYYHWKKNYLKVLLEELHATL